MADRIQGEGVLWGFTSLSDMEGDGNEYGGIKWDLCGSDAYVATSNAGKDVFSRDVGVAPTSIFPSKRSSLI